MQRPLREYGFFLIWQIDGDRFLDVDSSDAEPTEVGNFKLTEGSFSVISLETPHRGKANAATVGAVCIHAVVLFNDLSEGYVPCLTVTT
jgi:hypothetical protein